MKRNNRGMSLLEVLIAVIILSIVIIPFLHSFVTSYTVNARSKQTLRATTLAQNEMELFQKEKIEDLKDSSQFSYIVNELANGEINFKKEGVINDDSGRAMFDVYVTLDPERDTGERFEKVNTKIENANVQMNTLSVIDSARFIEPIQTATNIDTIDSKAYDFFVKSSAEAGKNKDITHFQNTANRTITVDIQQKDTNPSDSIDDLYTQVMVTYFYKCDAADVKKNIYKKTFTIFKNKDQLDEEGKRVELKSVYLYYAPQLNRKKDVIKVNNSANLPIDIYIIRQNIFNDDNTTIKPVPDGVGGYIPTLIINDTAPSGKYHTNLNIKSVVPATPSIGNQLHLKFNSANVLNGGARDTALEKLQMRDLTGKEVKDKIYNMRVEVYAAGGKEKSEAAYASLTGTKLE